MDVIHREAKAGEEKMNIYCDLCFEGEAVKVDRYGRKLCVSCWEDFVNECNEPIGGWDE